MKEENLKEELNELNDKYLRLYAEYENHKKRFVKQLKDLEIGTKRKSLLGFMAIIDDIDRYNSSKDIGAADLIFDKFKNYLSSQGITEIDSEIGSEFSVDKHDCIASVDVDGFETNQICEVVSKGFEMSGEIIKFPKVIVAK